MPENSQPGGGDRRYYGKYRGKVVNNIDPRARGRIQVIVPEVLGESTLVWALPCAPFAGPNVGFFSMPPVSANVWVEFEGGNPDHAIWAGCFWGEGDIDGIDATPQIFFFRTNLAKIRIDDAQGEITIETGSSKVTLNAIEAKIEAPVVTQDTGTGGKTQLTAAGFDAQQGALRVI
ncbi:MAG: phage baseplate assembly protein V [Pseudomonadota bacterium]